MGKGQRMRSTRRLMRAVEERRDLAQMVALTAHELDQDGTAEGRESARYWRQIAEALYREQMPVPRANLSALAAMHRGAVLWDQHLVDVVKLLRAQGVSWAQIGRQLEISGEGARKRYGSAA